MKPYILPLRDLVFQPGLNVPMYLDYPASIKCLEESASRKTRVVLAPQRVYNYPTRPEEMYDVGTLADIIQVLRMPDGAVHAMVQTIAAVNLSNITVESNGLFSADIDPIEQIDDSHEDGVIALRDRVIEGLKAVANPRRINIEKLKMLIGAYSMGAFVDATIQMMDIETNVAVNILKMSSYREKLTAVLEQIKLALEVVKIDRAIEKRVSTQMEGGRREMILQEKMRAIQKELGDEAEEDDQSYKKKILAANLPRDAADKAMTEWKKLRNMPPMSHDGSVIKTYLDELLSMPWNKSDRTEIDLTAARAALDSEHSGMNGVKENILEHLAVMKKTGNSRGTILCLVGAPGIGKTSLCKSIATALGRKYQRISLGGVSDESALRGHRKTYIASQPGRIMDSLKRTGVNNPVIVLDEIDKIGRDHRGDPESALLEILDPEQNKTFRDHYLEVDFDLSNVFFIATSNTLNMTPALRDRMEIIELPDYTESEKLAIARDHLIARAARDTGFHAEDIIIGDDAITHIIRNYTAESGVRELQRSITAMLRRTILENNGEDIKTEFTIEKIDALLKSHKSAGARRKIGFQIGARA